MYGVTGTLPTGENVTWHDHFEKQFSSVLESWTYTYSMILAFYSSVFTQEKKENVSIQRFVHKCSLQLHSLATEKKETAQLSTNQKQDNTRQGKGGSYCDAHNVGKY